MGVGEQLDGLARIFGSFGSPQLELAPFGCGTTTVDTLHSSKLGRAKWWKGEEGGIGCKISIKKMGARWRNLF